MGTSLKSLSLFFKARAREDTEKIDHGMKRKAARLHHITTVCVFSHSGKPKRLRIMFNGICISHIQILKDKAKSELKRAADQHWSDGALEVYISSSKWFFTLYLLVSCSSLEVVLYVYTFRCQKLGPRHWTQYNQLIRIEVIHITCLTTNFWDYLTWSSGREHKVKICTLFWGMVTSQLSNLTFPWVGLTLGMCTKWKCWSD